MATGRSPHLIPLMTVLLVVIGARVPLLLQVTDPGHGDPAFYFTVAKNLVAGRGLVIDHVWHYLNGIPELTHPSHDYWMPLSSVIMAIPMFMLGQGLLPALLPGLAAVVVLACISWDLTRRITGSTTAGWLAALLTGLSPSLFHYSLLTESTVHYAALAGLALWLTARGSDGPYSYVAAFGLAGFAQLTRQDGLLLVPVIGLMVILRGPTSWKPRMTVLALGMGTYVLVLLPLMLANLAAFDAVFPPGPSKTMYLKHYEDLYSLSKDLSLSSYLAWGWPRILHAKWQAIAYNTTGFLGMPGWPLLLLSMPLPILWVRDHSLGRTLAPLLPALLFFLVLFLFYGILGSVPSMKGAFLRSSNAVLPFVFPVPLLVVNRLVRWKAARMAVFLLIAASYLHESLAITAPVIARNTERAEGLRAMAAMIASDDERDVLQEPVVMTRSPWELHEATGLRCAQIPNDPLPVILRVADSLGVGYMELPAPRKALNGVVEGRRVVPRLERMGEVPGTRSVLFRVVPTLEEPG